MPNAFPSTTIINHIFGNYLGIFLWLLMPLQVAIRAYIVISIFFLAFSFFILTRAFSDNFLVRLGSTIFFLFNPAYILILTGGDFILMFSLGFLLLALYFVIVGRRKDNFPNIYLLISIVFMFLTIGTEQITYLGVALWIIFFVIFSKDLRFELKKLKNLASNLIIPLLFSFILMILVFLPFILPAEFGSFINLGPSSPYAQSFNGNVKLFSNGFFPTLFLEPWGFSSNVAEFSVATISVSALSAWNVILYSVLLFALVWGFIVRRRTLIVFSLIIVIAGLLGSGPKSLVPSIPNFLYLNIPGYQLLNASYYWDWIVIVPLYSLILVDILNYISIPRKNIFNKVKWFTDKDGSSKKHLRRTLAISFIVLLIFILVFPLVSQGYYNSLGIINRGQNVPQPYYGLTTEIDKLTTGTMSGVAFFPPNQELVLVNGSPHFNNPLYNSQSFRTPYISSYGSLPTNISNYFDFIYSEFYSNETNHIAELMGLAGIEYFVVLKGVKDYNDQYGSQNASQLMNYQTGISMISNNKSYTIYKGDYSLPTAFTTNTSEIIIGNYYSLTKLANEGVNLLGKSIFMSSDINVRDWKIILNHSNYVVLPNLTDLNTLGLVTTNFTKVDTFDYINNSDSGSSNPRYPLTNWAYGPNYYVPEISQIPTAPQNFIFTSSNSTVSIPIPGSKNHNEAWIQLWFSGDSRNVSFFTDGKLIQTVDTFLPGNSEFKLVKINYSFNKNQMLRINSSGLEDNWINAIGSIYLTNGTQLSDNRNYINNLISEGKLTIFNFSAFALSNVAIQDSNATLEPTEWGYKLLGGANKIFNINYPYYSDERSNGILLSSLGGVNQVIISVSAKTNFVYFTSYQMWVYGSIIQVASVASYLIFLFIRVKFFQHND
ncbi:MAG: hypothetical protein LVQ94_06245 [Thermoplasmatales archaeon]|nr:hypothetical protein [Thermoplasmatales archaeon]